MGMTIDEARTALGKERKYALHENKQAFDIAIDTMRKYQKIEEILDQLVDSKIRTYDAVTEIEDIVYGHEEVEDDDGTN